jgi:NAD(P)-dependent dehydrogenase (short-subunit alcohol dehydrogenase family)
MNDKIVLITGATNGIGQIAARALAEKGAHIIIAARSRERADQTVAEIKARTGKTIDVLLGDLSLMADARRVADQFKAKYDKLHVLINNAGAFFSARKVTQEGFETTFALNHLSYFLLTRQLLDVLKASAPARIINVSSDAHRVGALDFENMQGEKSYSGFLAYGRSKLMNVMFTYELARRLAGTGVTANTLHPGFVRTGFGRNNNPLMTFAMSIMQLGALSPEQGAQTTIYLASSPEVEGVTGKYFSKSKAIGTTPASMDEAAWKRLWEVSEQAVAPYIESVPATA